MTKETKIIKDLKERNDKLADQYRQLDIRHHCLNQNYEKLKRQIAIKDEYMKLIIALGFDYDGWNSVENLKELIDELVDLAKSGIKSDDKKVMYGDLNNDSYNILGEKIQV